MSRGNCVSTGICREQVPDGMISFPPRLRERERDPEKKKIRIYDQGRIQWKRVILVCMNENRNNRATSV